MGKNVISNKTVFKSTTAEGQSFYASPKQTICSRTSQYSINSIEYGESSDMSNNRSKGKNTEYNKASFNANISLKK